MTIPNCAPQPRRRWRAVVQAAIWAAILLPTLGLAPAWAPTTPVPVGTPAVVTDPEKVGPFGRYPSLRALWDALNTAEAAESPQPARDKARQAMWQLGEAGAALEQGDAAQAAVLARQGRATAWEAYWAAQPSVPGELRGVWMHHYADPSWPEAMRQLAGANFNAVFPYMMSGGVAFYRSRVLPQAAAVREGRDSLSQAVAAGRETGVPVHARMLNLSVLFSSPETRAALKKQGRLAVNGEGETVNWLCPTNPHNRQAQVAAALEMAAYGVAGIQFDYLRYPSADTCCCGNCRRQFERDVGVKVAKWPADALRGGYRGRFVEWRCAQLTRLVRSISHAVRRQYPQTYVSAAVFLNWEDHRVTFGQDWKVWIEQGLVDFVCPMDYTTTNSRFRLYVTRQRDWIGGKVPFAAGIGVYADGYDFPGPELVTEQVRMAREAGAKGFVIFNYSPELARDYLPFLAQGLTREPTAFDWLPLAQRGGGGE